MKPTTIRLSDGVQKMIAHAAEQDGVSVSQWIREAVTYRLGYRQALMDLSTGTREHETLDSILKELGYKFPEETISPPYRGPRPTARVDERGHPVAWETRDDDD